MLNEAGALLPDLFRNRIRGYQDFLAPEQHMYNVTAMAQSPRSFFPTTNPTNLRKINFHSTG